MDRPRRHGTSRFTRQMRRLRTRSCELTGLSRSNQRSTRCQRCLGNPRSPSTPYKRIPWGRAKPRWWSRTSSTTRCWASRWIWRRSSGCSSRTARWSSTRTGGTGSLSRTGTRWACRWWADSQRPAAGAPCCSPTHSWASAKTQPSLLLLRHFEFVRLGSLINPTNHICLYIYLSVCFAMLLSRITPAGHSFVACTKLRTPSLGTQAPSSFELIFKLALISSA